MNRFLSSILVLLLLACGNSQERVSIFKNFKHSTDEKDAVQVFVFAHPDDWQLFMGEFAYDAILKGGAVFICLTAGDNGKGESYWRTREKGMLASMRSVLKTDIFTGSAEEEGHFDFSGKQIYFKKLGNSYAYFYRLPDGTLTGKGQSNWQMQSLLKLDKEQIINIVSIDEKRNSFTKTELTASIAAIVRERSNQQDLRLHLLDSGTADNFAHSDHYSSYRFARSALDFLPSNDCKYYAHEDYRIKNKKKNIDSTTSGKKVQLFDAYSLTMLAFAGSCPMCEAHHFDWLFRSYYRRFSCH